MWNDDIVVYARNQIALVEPQDGTLLRNATLDGSWARTLTQAGDQLVLLGPKGNVSAVSLPTMMPSWAFAPPRSWAVTRFSAISPQLSADGDEDQLVASMRHSLLEWNLSTGHLRWNYTFGVIDEIHHAVTDSHVVGINAIGGQMRFRAFQATTGHPVWDRTVNAKIAPSDRAEGPVTAGLGEMVHVLQQDGRLISLDGRDGTVRGSVELPMHVRRGTIRSACTGDEAFCPSSGIVLVLERARGVLYAVQPEAGVLWQTDASHDARVSARGQTVFVAGASQLRAIGLDDGDVRWTVDLSYERSRPPPESLVVLGGILVVGIAAALGAILWMRRRRHGS